MKQTLVISMFLMTQNVEVNLIFKLSLVKNYLLILLISDKIYDISAATTTTTTTSTTTSTTSTTTMTTTTTRTKPPSFTEASLSGKTAQIL